MKHQYGRIPVVTVSHEEMMGKLEERIRQGEQKYGMTSAEMLALVSTRDDKWETPEILRWMQAYHAYRYGCTKF